MQRPTSIYTTSVALAATEMARQEAHLSPQQAQEALEKMLRGIQRFEAYNKPILRPKTRVIEAFGELTLNALNLSNSGMSSGIRTPVLLIPSMVNSSDILNLTHDKSMMLYLYERGFEPILLDWGKAPDDRGQHDIRALMKRRLLPAIEYIANTCQKCTPRRGVSVLGYCMGGTFLVAAASMRPDLFNSIACLATPWDFHRGNGFLKSKIDFWKQSFEVGSGSSKAVLGNNWLQTLFASLDPLALRDKFITFASLPQGTLQETLFVAIENWLNNGSDIPIEIASMCIHEWYDNNAPALGQWDIGGHTVRAQDVKAPLCVIASKQDRLVDFEGAKALADQAQCSKLVEANCGHIGMIASKQAKEEIWQPIAEYFAYCNAI